MSDSQTDHLRMGFDDPSVEALYWSEWDKDDAVARGNELERAIDELLADEYAARVTSRGGRVGAALARIFVAALLVCVVLFVLGLAVRLVAWAWGQ